MLKSALSIVSIGLLCVVGYAYFWGDLPQRRQAAVIVDGTLQLSAESLRKASEVLQNLRTPEDDQAIGHLQNRIQTLSQHAQSFSEEQQAKLEQWQAELKKLEQTWDSFLNAEDESQKLGLKESIQTQAEQLISQADQLLQPQEKPSENK